MRFQTIGLLALFIIVIGAIGIYKSDDLNSMSSKKNTEHTEPVIQQVKTMAMAIKESTEAGSLVLRDSFELLPVAFEEGKKDMYILEDEFKELPEIFILKNKMDKGQFASRDDLENLKNDFIDMVLNIDTSAVEHFEAGFYDVYWHFNNSIRDKNSRKIKLFSKNVFIRPVKKDALDGANDTASLSHINREEREYSQLTPVVFSVSKEVEVEKQYLQASQLGYFKIVHVTPININLENYSTLEVDSSEEIQANDISPSYKYDVNFIE